MNKRIPEMNIIHFTHKDFPFLKPLVFEERPLQGDTEFLWMLQVGYEQDADNEIWIIKHKGKQPYYCNLTGHYKSLELAMRSVMADYASKLDPLAVQQLKHFYTKLNQQTNEPTN